MSDRSSEITLSSSEIADLAAEVLARGHALRVRVRGQSMEPTLRSGDRVTLAPVDPGDLEPGDLVLVRQTRCLIHRVCRVDRSAHSLTTRGDARASDDPPIDLQDVLGRVVRVERPWWKRLPIARMVASLRRASLISLKRADSGRSLVN